MRNTAAIILALATFTACSDQSYDCDPTSPDCYENPNYGKQATPTPTPTDTPYTASEVTKPAPTPTVTVTVTPTPEATPTPEPTPTVTPAPTPNVTPTPTITPTPAQLLYITEGMGTLLANNNCASCSQTLLSNVAPFYHDAAETSFTTTQSIYDLYANAGTCSLVSRQFSIDVTPGHDTHWNGVLSDIRTMNCESGHQATCSCVYVVQGYTQKPN